MKYKRKKAPLVLACIQAFILLAFAVLFFCEEYFYAVENGYGDAATAAMVVLVALAGYAVLILIFGVVGTKYRWGAGVLTVLSAVGSVAMIFGLIGGIIGLCDPGKPVSQLSHLQEKEEAGKRQEAAAASADRLSVAESYAADEGETDEKTDESGQSIPSETLQGEASPSQVKMPDKKLSLGLFIGMGIYYLIWLVIGILTMTMPQKGIAWGPYDDAEYTAAMNIVTGFMMILQMPSFGYFFVFRGPVRLSKKVCVAVVASCIAVTVAGDVLFYVLTGKYLALVGITMKLAPVLSEVGLLGIYLVGFLRVAPEKLKPSSYEKTGETWKDILGELFCRFMNLLKFLIRNRNKIGFIIGGTVLFTLCVFCLLEALYVLLGIVLVLLFVLLINSLYMPTYRHQYYVTDSSATLRTLTYSDYNGFSGEDIYRDEIGNRWATTDGGKTFYPITADNNRHEEDSASAQLKNR